jgi:putative tryptophan/tyrosine transport system substrate-binding protein
MARDRVERTRRRFLQGGLALTGLSLLSGCGVLPLPSHQAAKVSRIGFLAVGSRDGRASLIEGFLDGLREQGYVEGQNIVVEYRFSDGQDERLPQLAAELIGVPVALILASGAPASFAARDATSTIPIVMGSLGADPVESGLIASLARPGGNITGMTSISAQLSGKRLELLQEVVPGLSRVAVFWNPPNPTYGPILKALDAAAQTLELQRLEVRAPEDFEGAFEAATRSRAGALIVPADPLTFNRPRVVADLALKYRMPTMMEPREFVEAGCLLSLGSNHADLYRRSATHVDKILKGASPADIPMEQPTKFDFAVNLKTAQALGLTIPQSVLQQATEIIQ